MITNYSPFARSFSRLQKKKVTQFFCTTFALWRLLYHNCNYRSILMRSTQDEKNQKKKIPFPNDRSESRSQQFMWIIRRDKHKKKILVRYQNKFRLTNTKFVRKKTSDQDRTCSET